jgi:hypothetical protein
MPGRSDGTAVPVLAACLAVLAVGAWQWQLSVLRSARGELKGETWEQAKTQHPMPPEPIQTPALSADVVEAVTAAQPFSPQRRATAGSPDGGGGPVAVEPAKPPAPKFLYKGRINVGTRQRAIIEDTTAKKTYFLELGQAVAGFKVLDMAETQVVLSDPQTHENVIVPLASKGGP